MREGLYDLLLTQRLSERLNRLRGLATLRERLPPAERASRLALFLAEEVRRLLGDHPSAPETGEHAQLVNDLLGALTQRLGVEAANAVVSPEEVLLAIHRGPAPPLRPFAPLGMSTLLARPGKPDLGQELGREVVSADRIDALVSFVTWTGVRRVRRALEDHAASGRPFRLITTTYTGVTDAAAVREIAKLPGAQVRVSFDGRRSRIHAKAWLFHRETGFSTVWVGSANLSASALAGGLEWTIKAAEADLKHVVDLFRGAFDSLWADPEFELIDPNDEDQWQRLNKALGSARERPTTLEDAPVFFDLRPYSYQEEILDTLAEAREGRGKRRNLVVAATGTGKTMLAAFDYARERAKRPLSLLFLAHREELLRQARTSFRHVLRDGSFGELLTGSEKPIEATHLFATIQSLARGDLIGRVGSSFWSYVVIDECHHAPADSYQALLGKLEPSILLGLTATPERSDGESLLPDFDGEIAAELRLWHALEKQLIVPFEYYGLADETDFSAVEWKRGGYDLATLENLLTGNDRRAELIADKFRSFRGDWRQSRTLAFCVGIRHAEFMAQKFNQYGIKAMVVHGDTPPSLRKDASRLLQTGEVNVLFTCDLFNEGIDLPFVDTLLFLRPTASATVFLQQLGRGLRLAPGKSSCLVLDFVGQHRREFRFDDVLSSLTGIPRGRLTREAENDFPTLPAGCVLQLDRVARERILESLRRTLRGGEQRLADELRQSGSLSLAQFLEHTGRQIEQVYAAGGMTHLRRLAGQLPVKDERDLNKRFRHLLHIDDEARLATLRHAASAPPVERLMLGYQLFDKGTDIFGPDDWLSRLSPEMIGELSELADVLAARAHAITSPPLVNGWPIHLHRSYERREILTGCGYWDATRKPTSREGVVRINGAHTELFFVTLDKSDGGFSPTTSYRDYAISRELFHWESQNSASEDSPAGRRYIEIEQSGWRFLLFVRDTPSHPFVALGFAHYVSHTGNRPMGITWRLENPLPAALFERFAALLAA